jgi:NDP-sugar pyrophosphorylase family protein
MTAARPPIGEPDGAASGLRAVILAGGRGVRLRPFTVNFPKPLVPLGDEPIIEVLMQRLLRFGIRDVTLSLGHLAELMKAFFHHRQQLTSQFTLRFVEEDRPTGTAGSLAMVPDLTDTFLVMNGDLLTDLDFHELVAFHRRHGAALTIATHERKIKIDPGVLEFDKDFRIHGYREKPEHRYDVSMGIYVYETRVLQFIEPGKYLDFPDLVLRLVEKGELVSAFPTNCLWLDIGRPDDYAKAQELYCNGRDEVEHV